ncbi:high affinity cAMP-specific and IBMX-insensitive 3',5'-cyclic phosphodiesterase 8 isoform X6 [Anopheles funestus]|uniref:high affinity cAMP-specific and IBMX-insensitive 3',5'-cyclic phosphodiesterase 8 isoform X6 n=1 Tax=Anopheles funestus TaxID=62324 RepID=UPI0020C63730|nr:high affinity cAMP-specific and IBMX-insensitive 3',5'-cyclic phosphodiesterase 8 isoform X6 [Anopheles funestus]XP_049296479.1 high affinity cAMP-specific and IBMX-insensitive 3',5'-cyclic phosphodiesterase 8 isoform X6 [Anopheles funestus]XP_049296480.1 high affinity cAMP-specific and IBMX-insensitive 3',5'-cyclic phosphodiesterase 8 isoform X6 [Anopheles funestus]XP_049296481.1 high affinity cAMP-specific and IBMX-insensitive 3',5'-cyclic phosphodiesterase 8 isoform X6 [Anopheles funestus]
MIIITGSTSNGDGDLPTNVGEDDERHQIELVGYGARNGSVGTLEEGTSLELSPVVEGVSMDEEETEASGDTSGGDGSAEDQQLANGATCQLDLDQKCMSDEEDSLLVDGKLRNLISFCSKFHQYSSARLCCGTSSSSGRYGHRKSSLALTPEEEPLDSCPRLVSDLKFPNLLPPNPVIKILIAFCKNDPVFDALVNASHRLSLEPTFVKSAESAIEAFQNPSSGGHHIIIVDARYPRTMEAEALGRSIRNSKGSQHTTMVAVVKKSVFEKDDTAVISLLDVGYNRCIIESPHVSICSSELRQIQHSLVRPQNVISTQQALYTALHRSREAVIITDDTLRAQYANRASERVLNMKLDEIVGRSLNDLVTADISNILSHTSRYKDYDGYLTTRRKSQESSQIHVRAVPVSCIGRNPTHLVLILESSSSALVSSNAIGEALQTLPQGKEVPRGSLHSIRRGSFDVRSIASDGLRRTSLAKLSSLPLEAPITKVLSLLAQVQENCSLEEAKLLDRVMEFLKREGLYSPQMKEIRTEDPVATDLIGALLTQGPTNILSSRRSSNDSIIRGGGRPSTGSIVFNKTKESSELSDLLQTALDWDFEIFKLEELTEKRPLVCLGLELFRRFDVYNTFNCDEMTFKLWLIEMEKHYHSENTYHNSTHAADVMQATAVYLQQLSNREIKIMDRMDEATALIAAATHDIDHPGRSSAFLCNSDSSLALLYNDICVLESHHAATTFRLTLADDKINIFKNLDRDMYKLARSIIVDMILATEMTRHFEHLAKFVSVFGTDVESKEPLAPDNDDNQILVRRMLIKCADVSNPTRPLKFCVEWARRIAEEYFMQTDEEKRKNLPIVMPMFDRTTCSISKSQIGFIEYIIHDMMDAWNSFIEMPEIIRYMEFNYSQWKLFEEQGINTLSDIKRKQMSLNEETASSISLEEKF